MKIRIRLIPLILTVNLLISLTAVNAQDNILSPRIASYVIDVELDTENKRLTAETELTWKNTSSEPVSTLYFHLYYNAFKNSESTFFEERGVGSFLTKNIDEECGWSWSRVFNMRDASGNVLDDNMKYVAPDDGNENDETVLRVELAEAIPAGESHTFNFDWEAKVPRTMPRTGYNKEYYFFAQWFPKLGVYELAGQRFATEDQWNCHQYHSSGEYYSDFGNYEVNITVPEDYVVASSGFLSGQSKKDGKRTWTYKVNDVIDFTWTTSPHYEIQEEEYKHTKILLYTYPYKVGYGERYLSATKFAMEYLDKHLGEYPYPTLSIIDPPIHGMFTGGMEYPTLITSLSFDFFPEGIRTPETLVVHEYIHQYFMQMVANHEVEEAWMDEGITTYYEGRILDAFLGEQNSTIDFLGIKCGNKEYNRAEFFGSQNPKVASNAIKSWQYKHGGYGNIAYNKAALWLQTLEGIIGRERIDKVFKIYFNRWKFKHPSRLDFIDVVNEVVTAEMSDKFPDGMDWYFEQVLYGTNECDYSVAFINTTVGEKEWGFYDNREDCEIKIDDKETIYTKIRLYRLGEVSVPQEIEVRFENGTSKMYFWDGLERAHELLIESDVKVRSAEIDPQHKIMLDKNFLNNSKTTERQDKPIRKISAYIMSGLQHLAESISFLI